MKIIRMIMKQQMLVLHGIQAGRMSAGDCGQGRMGYTGQQSFAMQREAHPRSIRNAG